MNWDAAEKWYTTCVGEKGHYYHQSIILPNAMRLIGLKNGSLLDLGCGQGVLARALPESIDYVGIDLSKELIQTANQLTRRKNCLFYEGDASGQLPIKKNDFDRVVCILSLQNMEHGEKVIANASKHLKKGGKLLLVLNHPCFRIPRQSGWGIDEKSHLQYRRMNGYLTPMKIPLQIHPSKREKSTIFYSYHSPLSNYMLWLSRSRLAIIALEEWVSDKKSTGSKASMENRARKEFPLFLAILAK